MSYETTIGLEVHIQLKTSSKLFSTASTKFGQAPNTQASLVDLAYPGTLPVLNEQAIDQAIIFGIAVGAEIHPKSVFARKNYFYPDLPKGYQTSQYEDPIVFDGALDITVDGQTKSVTIERAHLEEDAGKSTHDLLPTQSAIDLNRAGSPLLEIVTAPVLTGTKDALAYLKKLHQLVCYLGICDGNMQEGSFRCDVNISLKPKGQKELGTRAEIKNLNSFRFIEKAIEYEQARQADLLDQGKKVVQQTRLFQESTMTTKPMRDKEDAHDYRYFPCPDLMEVEVTEERIEKIKQTLPRLPSQWEQLLKETYGLSDYDTQVLLDNSQMLFFIESALSLQQHQSAKSLANWLTTDILGFLNKEQRSFSELSLTPQDLAKLTDRVFDKTLSSKTAKQVLGFLLEGQSDVDLIIDKNNLKQVSDSGALNKIVETLISQNEDQWMELKSGKDKLIGFFVGQAMKQTQGRANPAEIKQILKSKLTSDD